MKAVVVYENGGPEVMKIEEVPNPKPEKDQILVNIFAVGINPVDTYLRAGVQGYTPPLPYTPGFDAAGVVEAIGDEVEKFAAGDRVYTAGSVSGTYAEMALCEEKHLHHLPRNTSFKQGAALGIPYATAYRALFDKGDAKPAQTVLIHGASGGVGTAATQFAAAAGLAIIATAGSVKGKALVREQGAHHVLDHNDPDHFEKIKEITEGKGVDLVIEFLANVNLAHDLDILAKKGKVVVVGSRGTIEIDPRQLMMKDAQIRGMSLMNAGKRSKRRIYTAINTGLENETLIPIIGAETPLDDVVKAHHQVMEEKAYGHIVLSPYQ